jgi:hypothetical protein
MRHRRLLALGSLAVLVTMLTAACATRTVNHILADPSRYRDRQVTLKGTVTESIGAMGYGAYRLEDHTGSMWVVSDRGVPRRGARVKVSGTIREGFNLGSIGERLPRAIGAGIVLIESSHRADW